MACLSNSLKEKYLDSFLLYCAFSHEKLQKLTARFHSTFTIKKNLCTSDGLHEKHKQNPAKIPMQTQVSFNYNLVCRKFWQIYLQSDLLELKLGHQLLS